MIKILKFYKDRCAPCVIVNNVINSLNLDNVESINVTEGPDLAAQYGITSVPTLIFEKDGVEVYRRTGAVTEGVIERIINGIQDGEDEEESE